MVKYGMMELGMMELTEREKNDVSDADMTMGWKLQLAAGAVVGERKRESWRDRMRDWDTTCETGVFKRSTHICKLGLQL
jgi:hypothetical protein